MFWANHAKPSDPFSLATSHRDEEGRQFHMQSRLSLLEHFIEALGP
jgi:hypothetical protein